ncbi:MAG: antibiotic biosynthesis monooxygenase [Sulfitobacter sp.]|nr:antibiotic biosynthesis monooxygenase [Sulfitobacter sp.]
MIAMIFEFTFDPTRPELLDEVLATSEELRLLLADVDGFEGAELFQSCSIPDKYVTVGFFVDEEPVAAWRNTPEHRRVQALGRSRFFTDYRIRMAEVTRDYTGTDRSRAPVDSRRAHDPGSIR